MAKKMKPIRPAPRRKTMGGWSRRKGPYRGKSPIRWGAMRYRSRLRPMSETVDFPYVYFWHRQGRKGQFCRVTARGKMNSCCVEFEDGYKMITSRNAIRRRK
jgi:hypothetical protein